MNDGPEVTEDHSALTPDDCARLLFLSPVVLLMVIVIFSVLINMALIRAQGGSERIRDDIREHAIENERLRQIQEWDRQKQEWIHGWDEHRRDPDGDNYAK